MCSFLFCLCLKNTHCTYVCVLVHVGIHTCVRRSHTHTHTSTHWPVNSKTNNCSELGGRNHISSSPSLPCILSLHPVWWISRSMCCLEALRDLSPPSQGHMGNICLRRASDKWYSTPAISLSSTPDPAIGRGVRGHDTHTHTHTHTHGTENCQWFYPSRGIVNCFLIWLYLYFAQNTEKFLEILEV